MVVEMEEEKGEVMGKHVIGGMSDLVIPEYDPPIVGDSLATSQESAYILEDHAELCRDLGCQGCEEVQP